MIEHAAIFEIGNEAVESAIELRDEHLMDLVLEDVIIPWHAVGDHDERSALLDKLPRHEGMLSEESRAVTGAVPFRQF